MKKLRKPTKAEASSVTLPAAAVALGQMLAPKLGVDPVALGTVLAALSGVLVNYMSKREERSK